MNRAHLGHLIAALLVGTRKPRPMDAAELEALRERCRKAGMLELGQILHETADTEGRGIVMAEISKRTGLC